MRRRTLRRLVRIVLVAWTVVFGANGAQACVEAVGVRAGSAPSRASPVAAAPNGDTDRSSQHCPTAPDAAPSAVLDSADSAADHVAALATGPSFAIRSVRDVPLSRAVSTGAVAPALLPIYLVAHRLLL